MPALHRMVQLLVIRKTLVAQRKSFSDDKKREREVGVAVTDRMGKDGSQMIGSALGVIFEVSHVSLWALFWKVKGLPG